MHDLKFILIFILIVLLGLFIVDMRGISWEFIIFFLFFRHSGLFLSWI